MPQCVILLFRMGWTGSRCSSCNGEYSWFGLAWCVSVVMHMDGVGAIGEASSDLDRVITAKNGTTQASMKYKSLKVHH